MDKLKKERELLTSGFKTICCVDEVGRGCFAGPVLAAAIILPPDLSIEGLTDSKKLSKKKLKELDAIIKEVALGYSFGIATVEEIDELNIKQATRLAMKRAIEGLNEVPDYILIDGLEQVDLPIPQEYVVKGDLNCHGISAASVIAKVERDEMMRELDKEYGSVYGWAKSAGYWTKAHREAVLQHGLVEGVHRRSWVTYSEMENELKKK